MISHPWPPSVEIPHAPGFVNDCPRCGLQVFSSRSCSPQELDEDCSRQGLQYACDAYAVSETLES